MTTTAAFRPYFAHAVNAYDTPLERAVVALIANYFRIRPESIENPNQEHHQVGYTAYAARVSASDTAHKGMNYFYDEVLPACHSCVAMPFLDGRMGLGVAGEAKWFLERWLPVYIVLPTCFVTWVTPRMLRHFEQDPTDGLFEVRPIYDREAAMVIASDPELVVPHLETRLRTWIRYGVEPKRPFESAHLATMPLPSDFYPETK